MTEIEARRILNEALTEYPRFVEGRQMFIVRPDGIVERWAAVGKSGQRWKTDGLLRPDDWRLPKRVSARAIEERAGVEVKTKSLPSWEVQS